MYHTSVYILILAVSLSFLTAASTSSTSSSEDSDSSFDGPLFPIEVNPLANIEEVIPWMLSSSWKSHQISAVVRRARATLEFCKPNDTELENQTCTNIRKTLEHLGNLVKLDQHALDYLNGNFQINRKALSNEEIDKIEVLLEGSKETGSLWHQAEMTTKILIAKYLIGQMAQLWNFQKIPQSLQKTCDDLILQGKSSNPLVVLRWMYENLAMSNNEQMAILKVLEVPGTVEWSKCEEAAKLLLTAKDELSDTFKLLKDLKVIIIRNKDYSSSEIDENDGDGGDDSEGSSSDLRDD